MTKDIMKELEKESTLFQIRCPKCNKILRKRIKHCNVNSIIVKYYSKKRIILAHNKIVDELKKKIKELEEECLESAKTKIPYIAKVDEQKEQLQAKDKEIAELKSKINNKGEK